MIPVELWMELKQKQHEERMEFLQSALEEYGTDLEGGEEDADPDS